MSGFVYFIEREPGDYIKIGWAKHGPFGRVSALQTGCPDLLIVRAYFEGSQEDERRMHEAFADLRGRGEWFANVLKLSDFMNYLEDVHAQRAITEDELVTAIHDCLLTGHYYEPHYLVPEATYDESGDWRPWAHLLEKHDLLEVAD